MASNAGQNGRCDVAQAQAATTFHCFRNLPVELQLKIWDHACAALETSPSVLCFRLEVFPTFEGRVSCLTPHEHVSSSTLAHRALLGTCCISRQKALEKVDMITLFRFDTSSRTITEYRIPFDFEKTCFCIGGWARHGLIQGRMGAVSGMDFAKTVKRLAFIIRDEDIKTPVNTATRPLDSIQEELWQLALLFHNAAHIGVITRSAADTRSRLTDEAFLSLFSFQPFVQKEMVQGFLMTRNRHQRGREFYDAINSALDGWRERLQAAVQASPGALELCRILTEDGRRSGPQE